MSFQSKVKAELYGLEIKSMCCAISEYSAIRYTSLPKLKTENMKYAERLKYLIKRVQGIDIDIVINTAKDKLGYEIVFPEYNDKSNVTDECCKRAFIRGLYITSGRINNPEKAAHLEIDFKDKLTFSKCLSYLESFDIAAKTTMRGKRFLIYFKNQESVSDLLTVIGAHKSVCDFENARIIKEIRNNTNRAVNCDNANIQKANDAAYRQITAINELIERQKLNGLPEHLQQTALVRIENPELDLTELSQLVNPPISKAGIAHRLNKIIQIANGEQDILH